MQKTLTFLIVLSFALTVSGHSSFSQSVEKKVKHATVFYEPDRCGGWPANYGIWSWGNEILVGFQKAFYEDRGPKSHNIAWEKPKSDILARSMDGGQTWSVEDPGRSGGLNYPDCSVAMNFLHPDFALTARRSDWQSGVFYSYDRGKS